MPRVNIGGEPGETYTNDSGKVLYQFFADWVRTCGVCASYDSQVGPSWPIPLHRNCRCRQVAIWPGATSRPFTDFREKIAQLDPAQRAKVVGVANLQLIDAGVVKWEDVVTGQRVRDLREVVATKKLSVATMTKAGVSAGVAERAYATVNTPAQALADQQRKELLAKVLAKGVTKAQLKQALGERLAARVGVTGPGGAAAMPVTPTPPKVPRAPRKKAPELVSATARADYLKKAKVKEEVATRIAREEAAGAKKGAAPGGITRAEVEDRLRDLETAAEKDAAILALVRDRQSATTTAARSAGMSTPETFRTVAFEGTRYYFRDDNPGPLLETLRLSAEALPIPRGIARYTTDVYLASQANAADAYWQVVYNNPDHVSAATGGSNREVTVYGDRRAGPSILAHEMGHNLATGVYGGTAPPAGSPFYRAWTSKEQPWTAYAKNSIDEDFAESVLEYAMQPDVMKTFRPLRYQAIEELVRASDAGTTP